MAVTRAGSASPARTGAVFSGPGASKESEDQESTETKGKVLKSNLSPLSKGKAVLKYSSDSSLPNVIEDDVGGSNELKEANMHVSAELIGKQLKRKHVPLLKSKVSAKKAKKLSIGGSSRVKCKANKKFAKKNVSLLDKPKNSNPIGLYSKFFGDHTRGISRIIVEERFKAANFDNDDEAVRMDVLYLITNFLYAWQKEKNIEKTDLYLCDSGGFNHFPWGNDIFNVTLSSLRDALRENEVVITRQGAYPTYKLNGLPFVFQVFIYKSIPSLEGTYYEKVSCGLPRIINWSSVAIPSHKELERNVFSLHKTKIVKVLPTDEENNAFKLEVFFQCNKDLNVADFEDDDFVAPPKKPTSEAPSSSYVPCVTFGFSDLKIIVDECQKKCNIMSKEIAMLKFASESRHGALMEMLVNLKNDQDLKYKAVMEILGELRPKSCGINDDIDPVDGGFVGADVVDTSSGGGGVLKENDQFFENESFTQVFDECIQAMQEDAAGDMVIVDDKNNKINKNEKTTGNDIEETKVCILI
ncbi:uncharacterized protein LOC133779673 [Humulus lupulus]|uniref:uncharacterized protein LOC133779673 n=1 Tax=Humulus lupulus TaxID=3486 RepID=UPI002B407779|nr:uncharacterized protein LOC133779673 [Humulus lupulus]